MTDVGLDLVDDEGQLGKLVIEKAVLVDLSSHRQPSRPVTRISYGSKTRAVDDPRHSET